MKHTRTMYKVAIIVIFCLFTSMKAKAESQAACSIWLCLPGGFPSGCGDAYNEFRKRIRNGSPPLPPLSSCVVHSSGQSAKGSYELGSEDFYPCDMSHQLFIRYEDGRPRGYCIPSRSACRNNQPGADKGKLDCEIYPAQKRIEKNFIKIWINNKYIGQFFYQ